MTAVTVPDLDQDTRNELAPGCECSDCDAAATHRMRMRRQCDCRPTMALSCTPHAKTYTAMGRGRLFCSEHMTAAITVSVVPL